MVYRGADQPDMSVINPESDVWQHIKVVSHSMWKYHHWLFSKIPQDYLATNWPIRYSSLSSDGRLIAVAGRRGLVHYSSASGRWKVFADIVQEQAFTVRGGLLWFHHVLIAAVEVSKSYQVGTSLLSGKATLTQSCCRSDFILATLNSAVKICSIAKLSHHPSSSFHLSTIPYLSTLPITRFPTTSLCPPQIQLFFICAEA